MGRPRRVQESRASWGISPPDVGELSRRFEGAMAFIVKGGVSIVRCQLELIDDGDTTLKNEGHSAFETSGQLTHIRRRYPPRCLGLKRHKLNKPGYISDS